MATIRKKIAFFPAHPSQIWMLSPVAERASDFADVLWIIRDKDCTVSLARELGLDFLTLSVASNGLIGNAIEMVKNIFNCMKVGKEHGIDLWVSKYGSANIAARLQGKLSISFNDDDADIVPFIAWTSYPFAHLVATPSVTRMGIFSKRNMRYPSNHELFYLHPNRFCADKNIRKELSIPQRKKFGLIRLSALTAHHDKNALGMEDRLALEIIAALPNFSIFISSERALSEKLEPFRIQIPTSRIHHALAEAEFLVGDSQTMTAEAAVLGTAAFRISSFVGSLSYINQLEDHLLAFGYLPEEAGKLLSDLKSFCSNPQSQTIMMARRLEFLSKMIDPVPWFVERIRLLLKEQTIKKARG